MAVVCDRCRSDLAGVEELEIDAFDEEGSGLDGKDDITTKLCRKCFDELKAWLRAWVRLPPPARAAVVRGRR